ncbi:MAG: glycosyltransferase [Candidatus Methanomethylophilaceae archaeon]
MNAALICTLKNEADGLKGFLESIDAQTMRPDEFIIVDGGSTDGSLEVLHDYAQVRPWVRIVLAEGANISQGGNIAIRDAKSRIVASTDAGCLLEPDWFQLIVAPILDGRADVVAGGYELSTHTAFQKCLNAVVSSDRHLWDAETFLPSSRSIAFKRQAWEEVHGYPEWLRYGEDTYFDLRLREAGFRFIVEPEAVVRWEARKDLPSVARQYYRYHHWDVLAGNFPNKVLLTLPILTFGALLLAVALLMEILLIPAVLGVFIIGGILRYGVLVYTKTGCPWCLVYSPLVAATILISENLGRLSGLIRRPFFFHKRKFP